MNRGRRGESVFLEKQDYSLFVEPLKEVVDMYAKPRNVSIIIQRLKGEQLEEIGRQFGIAKYSSSVSSAIEK